MPPKKSRIATSTRPPRVSIIIPCFNGEPFIGLALQSALAQTHPNKEIIFVDDGSQDRSLAIAQAFPEVIAMSQKNLGVSAARNAGLERASGEFIIFLDADDQLLPDATKRHLEAFAAHDEISMVYGSNRVIDAKGRIIAENPQPAHGFGWREVVLGEIPAPSQTMFKRELLLDVSAFDTAVTLGEDFDLYLRLTKIGNGHCHGNLVADYRKHPQQATTRPSASLVGVLKVLETFKNSFDSSTHSSDIWIKARRHWISYYGQYIPHEIVKSALHRKWLRAAAALKAYIQYGPYTFVGTVRYLMDRVYS